MTADIRLTSQGSISHEPWFNPGADSMRAYLFHSALRHGNVGRRIAGLPGFRPKGHRSTRVRLASDRIDRAGVAPESVRGSSLPDRDCAGRSGGGCDVSRTSPVGGHTATEPTLDEADECHGGESHHAADLGPTRNRRPVMPWSMQARMKKGVSERSPPFPFT